MLPASCPPPTTVFVLTIGDEANFTDCMEHLRAQTVTRPIEIVDRVAPLSTALGQMQERCRTPFYVQVDEDMILFPHAIESLEAHLAAAPENVPMVCAPLWDCDTAMPLYGVKIYRHSIVSRFPYEDVLASESTQLDRMKAAGFPVQLLPLGEHPEDCLGEHGKHYAPATIYMRWRRMLQKHQRCPGRDWVKPWPQRLLDRYLTTRDPVHLYALLGAVSGIVGEPLPDGEMDFRRTDEALARLQSFFAIDR
jgi:hypothetical protein